MPVDDARHSMGQGDVREEKWGDVGAEEERGRADGVNSEDCIQEGNAGRSQGGCG